MKYYILFFLCQIFFGSREFKEIYEKLIFIKKKTYNCGVMKYFSFWTQLRQLKTSYFKIFFEFYFRICFLQNSKSNYQLIQVVVYMKFTKVGFKVWQK